MMFQLQGDASSQFSKVSAEMVVDYTSDFITYEVNLFELILSYYVKIFWLIVLQRLMLLLFLQIFRSRVDLCKWVVEVGRRNGFIIVTKKLDSSASSKKPRIPLACERSGQYRESKKDVNQEKKTCSVR